MGKTESLRSTVLLIHFSARSGGWLPRGKPDRLACGIALDPARLRLRAACFSPSASIYWLAIWCNPSSRRRPGS